MSRVLLVGVGPLPAPERKRLYAPGLRLEAFLGALLRAESEVVLGEIYFSGIKDTFLPRRDPGIREHRLLGPNIEEITRQISQLCDEFKPDALVALTDVGCFTASRSSFEGPLHADYFGHPMAERQQQAAVHASDAALAEQWLLVLPTLLRADRFSACSNAQRLALTGELGAAGRLNSHTNGHEFVEIVPPTLPFADPLRKHRAGYLQSKGIPAGAPVIFASGGYNTWVDEKTLFEGIDEALRRREDLHFVTTGGAIEGHVEIVYTRFCERIARSPQRERMHLLGWVPHDELEDSMQEATVALNVDNWSLEGELGCRNRLYGWLWAGLRVVTTVTSGPTQGLVDQGWVRAVPTANANALADALLSEIEQGRPNDLVARQHTLRQQWGPENFFQEFARWARSPERAPDRRDSPQVQNPLAEIQRRFLENADSDAQLRALRRSAREIADRLTGSRAIQLYGRVHGETRDLIEKLRKI